MVKNKSHTLAYSLIALQEMNLAYKDPIIFWNCANLICDSGGAEIEEEEEIVDIHEVEDDEDAEYEDLPNRSGKKKKTKVANYGKIATALGKMKTTGVLIQPPNINQSTFTFSPDVDTNSILFGLSGITRIGQDLILNIINNRPYNSLEDFLDKVKVNKTQMVNLIKCGAFDCFGDRISVMKEYVDLIADKKKRVTLQNMRMLIDFDLLPSDLDFEKKLFNFNKYIKKFKDGTDYLLNEVAYNFYEQHYDLDLLSQNEEGLFKIKQTSWDKIYKTGMDSVRNYIKKNSDRLLSEMNQRLYNEVWEKYCLGSISSWEMQSVNCYFHEHELEKVREHSHGFSDFVELPENPKIERIINIKGKQIPMFEINRICGTVIDKDKSKKTVTLLTKSGVVTVRIFGAVFNYYDKQISEKGSDGKKHVIEKSWFKRGNKVIITGMKRGQEFVAKKYKNTPYHLVELITDVDEYGKITTQTERYGAEEE